MLARATTATNAQRRRQHLIQASIKKSYELDNDYVQALKIIDQNRREKDPTPLLTKSRLHRSDSLRAKKPPTLNHFSSTLSPIGQQAMVKTYEDTLVHHLTNAYSSKRIGAVLPRLSTASFRHRLPVTKKTNQNHSNDIQIAQDLLDSILNKNCSKEEILSDYVRWQQQWIKQS